MSNKISIVPEIVTKYKLSKDSIFTLLNIQYNGSIKAGLQELIDKGLVSPKRVMNVDSTTEFFIMDVGTELLEAILIDSDKVPTKDDETKLVELANTLRGLYPNGKKPGTNYYWRDNIPTIVKKLKVFFKRYGYVNHQDVISATEKYIKSFNGNYQYMQLLKYFIWKDKIDGSQDSELLTYVENLDELEESISINTDWTTTLK